MERHGWFGCDVVRAAGGDARAAARRPPGLAHRLHRGAVRRAAAGTSTWTRWRWPRPTRRRCGRRAGPWRWSTRCCRARRRRGSRRMRPPGHHAEPRRAMGFCFFGNAAVAARHAQAAHGVERVLILDWDVHHGNGTNAIFHEDPSVLFVSIHEWPLYPGTGPASDLGAGDGEGYTVNLPVPGRVGRRDVPLAGRPRRAAADRRRGSPGWCWCRRGSTRTRSTRSRRAG